MLALFGTLLLASCSRARSVLDGDGRLCPPGAGGTAHSCVCRDDLRLLLGACVSPRIAEDHCGPSAIATAVDCAPRPPCEPGRPRDLANGECLPQRDARAIATSSGILVAEDERLECEAGGELAVGAPDSRGALAVGCIPPVKSASSTPSSRLAPCPAGSVRVPSGTECTRVIEGSSRRDARVDVVRWLQAVIGVEGGSAAPLLCEALARAPRSLSPSGVTSIPSGTGSRTQMTVSIVFQDNDVSALVWSLRLRGTITPPDPAVTVELSRAVAPLMEALRALGGAASQAAVESSVALNCPGGGGGAGEVVRPVARLVIAP